MIKTILLTISTAFLLSACTPTQVLKNISEANEALDDVTDGVAEAVGDYAQRVWDWRQETWTKCETILDLEIEQLKKEEKYAEARKLLAEAYAPLITTAFLKEGFDSPHLLGRLGARY